jgi:hypothetical protein
MAQNRLDGFIFYAQRMQVRCEAAAECVPPVPHGESLIALELMALGLVLFLGLAANRASVQGWKDHTAHKVIQVERLSVPRKSLGTVSL